MLTATFLREQIKTKKDNLDRMIKTVSDAIDYAIEDKKFFIDINNEEITVEIPKNALDILEDANVLNAFDDYMRNNREIKYIYRYATSDVMGKIVFKEYTPSDEEESKDDDISF